MGRQAGWRGVSGDSRQRLDVWLWRARLFKTRSEAARCIAAGGVRLAREGRVGAVSKAALLIGPGDRLTVATGGRVQSLRVVALGARRGPASEARTLYRNLAEDTHDADELDGEAPRTSSSHDS